MRRLMCECRGCHDQAQWWLRVAMAGRHPETRAVCHVHLQLLEREGALRLLGRRGGVESREAGEQDTISLPETADNHGFRQDAAGKNAACSTTRFSRCLSGDVSRVDQAATFGVFERSKADFSWRDRS